MCPVAKIVHIPDVGSVMARMSTPTVIVHVYVYLCTCVGKLEFIGYPPTHTTHTHTPTSTTQKQTF